MSTDAPIRLLVVAGSLREGSYNRLLARLAARLVPAGTEVEVFDGLAAVEPFDEDVEVAGDGWPAGARAFAAALRRADAVFVATPEYNGSVPGQLKNAFDWASRPDLTPGEGGLQASPMYGRLVTVASASNGQFGAVWARDELFKALRTQGARVLTEPKVAVPSAHLAFDDDGSLRSEDANEQLRALVEALVEQARTLRAARAAAAAATAEATTA